MKLHTAPQEQAILSNVSETGEFRIRNSAKAFNILSSGLYANKIRAIIRELSCNAWDSHVAAGATDKPFDLHLPTALEPWFSVRDYGTGLTDQQVKDIYTTYFESTKTASNDFVGALGLGSKSPFSYTDNFTVTAIRDGKKGVYSAFINGQGVPSIANMGMAETDEPDGVEVRFAVENQSDFRKFVDESRTVFSYFALQPNFTGAPVQVIIPSYKEENIVPGVHRLNGGYSRAVMGNIAYPIDVPNAEAVLGKAGASLLSNVLLEMRVEIGELDFQASREGLSYIPETIAAIKSRVDAVLAVLETRMLDQLNKITCRWARAVWLDKMENDNLYGNVVREYVKKNPGAELVETSSYGGISTKCFEFTHSQLKDRYNLQVSRVSRYAAHDSFSKVRDDTLVVDSAGQRSFEKGIKLSVEDGKVFIINDTKTGAMERAKYHFKTDATAVKDFGRVTLYLLRAADPKQPMLAEKFLQDIENPPHQLKASGMLEKPRARGFAAASVSLLVMERKNYGSDEWVWRESSASASDVKGKVYYVPLSGYVWLGKTSKVGSIYELWDAVQNCGLDLGVETLYGVRKSDIKSIETDPNWINLEDHLAKVVPALDPKSLKSLFRGRLDSGVGRILMKIKHSEIQDKNGLAYRVVSEYANLKSRTHDAGALGTLLSVFGGDKSKIAAAQQEFDKLLVDLENAYPILNKLSWYDADGYGTDYVNAMDLWNKQKKKAAKTKTA